jgi:hypothetical protein
MRSSEWRSSEQKQNCLIRTLWRVHPLTEVFNSCSVDILCEWWKREVMRIHKNQCIGCPIKNETDYIEVEILLHAPHVHILGVPTFSRLRPQTFRSFHRTLRVRKNR